MKQTFFFLVFVFSLSTGAYYGLGDLGSYDNERKLDEIARKQDCILKRQRAQQEYTDCLQDCQERKERNRQFGIRTYISSCFCSRPITLGCY